MSNNKFVPTPRFDDYKEQFKDFFFMERRNGVILLRMHTDGGPVVWNYEMHNALAQVWHVIGNDPDNEVMILTSTEPYWLGKADQIGMQKVASDKTQHYDLIYLDTIKLIEDLIFNIHFPTIAAVTGPGWHTEIATLCDITICTETAQFQDGHFIVGWVPGDGQGMVLQNLIGTKRAAYYMYTGKNIDAKTALELGLVNEVLPADKLINRAWELADMIMKQPRVIRRMTSEVIKRPWKRLIANDLHMHNAHEMYGSQLGGTEGNFSRITDSWCW